MPARDRYHKAVKAALIKDGWTITHDPLSMDWDDTTIYVDLGAERLLAAEKGLDKIAVEIKSFLGLSVVYDLHQALGQFKFYQDALDEEYSDRVLYLAVTEEVYRKVFVRPKVQRMVTRQEVRLIVFSATQEVIVQWIP